MQCFKKIHKVHLVGGEFFMLGIKAVETDAFMWTS